MLKHEEPEGYDFVLTLALKLVVLMSPMCLLFFSLTLRNLIFTLALIACLVSPW